MIRRGELPCQRIAVRRATAPLNNLPERIAA